MSVSLPLNNSISEFLFGLSVGWRVDQMNGVCGKGEKAFSTGRKGTWRKSLEDFHGRLRKDEKRRFCLNLEFCSKAYGRESSVYKLQHPNKTTFIQITKKYQIYLCKFHLLVRLLQTNLFETNLFQAKKFFYFPLSNSRKR